MRVIRALVTGHPVLTYYILTFAISWGGMLLVVGGPTGIPGTAEEVATLFGPALLAMLAGPTTAGMLLTGIVDGRAGFRELLSRLLSWRVSVRWYAVALLTTPLAMAVVPVALSPLVPVFLPGVLESSGKAALLQFSLTAGLMAGVLEELGWTGFATEDGRVTIMMPHPERAFRAIQLSYRPDGDASGDGPWMRLFLNAREFAG